mmetsp:Transcript_3659/g.14387  ORF Transcript_3659/g.14387 Transcript_3659/m.14387 type:complete len:711 (-) Transcript_3659:1464-3596(-)
MGCVDSRPDILGEAHQEPRLRPEELDWHVYANLDLQDEAEQLELARFLRKILKHMPTGTDDEGSVMSGPEKTLHDSGEDREKEEPAVQRESLVQRMSKGLSISTIAFHRAPKPAVMPESIRGAHLTVGVDGERLTNHRPVSMQQIAKYTIYEDEIDETTVKALLDLYRMGGKLAKESFQRLVRECYEMYLEAGNVNHVFVEEADERITVVGDLHGALRDLLYILDASGLPGARHRMIFNGDFVDRGEEGCETLAVLLALQLAFPDEVSLNRGNHEDEVICRIYGFETEVKSKYDAETFNMCCVMFRYIPLVTTINGVVLVLHGGLFHREDVTMEDIEEIPRHEYGTFEEGETAHKNPGWYRELPEEEQQRPMLKEINRDILWSDPMKEKGRELNRRGAGVRFGPDLCYQWLATNGFDLLVRSHEVVPDGFELPYRFCLNVSDGHHACATVFSSSDYTGIGNKGAVLSFRVKKAGEELENSKEISRGREVLPVGASSLEEAELYYVVYDFYTGQNKPDMGAYNGKTLATRILRKKSALGRAFEPKKASDGTVSLTQYSQVMTDVLDLQIHWRQVVPLVVPQEAVKVPEDGGEADRRIHVDTFLNSFDSVLTKKVKSAPKSDENDAILEQLYENSSRLEALFNFFDKDGNGEITKQEFVEGCDLINQRLPAGEQIRSAEKMLHLIDFDDSGMLDLNEFFEAFRLTDFRITND